MKSSKILSRFFGFLGFLFAVSAGYSQIGIGTTSPTRMLDVNGNVIVGSGTDPNINALVAADADGVLTSIGVSQDLVLNNGRLSTKGTVAYDLVTFDWSTISACTSGNETINNLNMGVNGANADKIVFKIINTNCTINIRGITGGVDGRHIYFYHTGTNTINFNNMDTDATAANRIDTLTGNKIVLKARGSIELIYDGDKSKWIVISFIE